MSVRCPNSSDRACPAPPHAAADRSLLRSRPDARMSSHNRRPGPTPPSRSFTEHRIKVARTLSPRGNQLPNPQQRHSQPPHTAAPRTAPARRRPAKCHSRHPRTTRTFTVNPTWVALSSRFHRLSISGIIHRLPKSPHLGLTGIGFEKGRKPLGWRGMPAVRRNHSSGDLLARLTTPPKSG